MSVMRQGQSRNDRCGTYDSGEVGRSHGPGHLANPVALIGPGRLMIGDFGVDWRHARPSVIANPELRRWLATWEADSSYRLEIVGYSDCVSVERNTALRQGRAERVEGLLGSSARSRVAFRGMAALPEFVAPNDTPENRARNRSVIIEFHQQYTFEADEPITVQPRRCGPDVTSWLVGQMSRNKDHPVIRTMREHAWPRYVPIFNIGWTAAALNDFADLVKSGAVWDFKSRQPSWHARAGASCPTSPCDRTVTICGLCFNYDVPGNIHYGWIGAAAQLSSWTLRTAAGLVQPGRWTDDPKDAVAVRIGERMWDNGANLCGELAAHRPSMNLHGTGQCGICSTSQ
jgi:hypothetical protein